VVTLRREPDHGDLVDVLGSTQPLARVVEDSGDAIVLSVPWLDGDVERSVVQLYRVRKRLGPHHVLAELESEEAL